jgi:hypothetical protein
MGVFETSQKTLVTAYFYLFCTARWARRSHTAIEFSWIYLYAVLILIKRADDSRDVLPNDMSINLGCAHIGMTK